MENLPFSVAGALGDIEHFAELLRSSIESNDRANVVRVCSHILYCVSDILEYALPDGVSITIK